MDQCMLDVSGVDGVREGMTVTVRTQFAPYDVQFTLRFCLLDAEDVIPYDEIANLRLYNCRLAVK